MGAAPATGAILDRLLTLASQKVIRIVAALISVGTDITAPWDIQSCEYPVICRRGVGAHIEVVLERAGEDIQIWRRARMSRV